MEILMKKQFILKGRLVKASLAETVIPEFGLEACIGEGGGRDWEGCFRKGCSMDRGVQCEFWVTVRGEWLRQEVSCVKGVCVHMI